MQCKCKSAMLFCMSWHWVVRQILLIMLKTLLYYHLASSVKQNLETETGIKRRGEIKVNFSLKCLKAPEGKGGEI